MPSPSPPTTSDDERATARPGAGSRAERQAIVPTALSTIAIPASWTGFTDSPRKVAAHSTPRPGWLSCSIEIVPTCTRCCAQEIRPCATIPDVTASNTTRIHPIADRSTIPADPPAALSAIGNVVMHAALDITAMNSAVARRLRAAFAFIR